MHTTNPKNKERTVKEVLDWETGEPVIAKELFENESEQALMKIRRELELAIQKNLPPKYVCYYCKQRVKISGGMGKRKQILHFAHLKNSDGCPYKTGAKFSREEIEKIKYNGAKESTLHKESKWFIAKHLEQNHLVQSVTVEKVYKDRAVSKEWKKPDILIDYQYYKKNIKVAIELQLSTTFLSVIVSREHFYAKNQTFILWIFRKFDIDATKQRFTDKDIFYSNNLNAFVLDDIAIQKSEDKNDLVLHCYYQKHFIENDELSFKWEDKYVTLQDLIFDKHNYKVYYHDVEGEQRRLKYQIKQNEDELHRRQIRHEEFQELFNYINFIRQEYSETELIGLFTRNMSIHSTFEKKIDELYIVKNIKTESVDSKFLNNEFKYFQDNIIINEVFTRKYMAHLAISILYVKFNNKPNYKKQVPKIRNIILPLLSLKFKKAIHFKHDNLIKISNSVKLSHVEIYIKAINEYFRGVDNFLDIYDKTGKFRRKLEIYYTNKPKQDRQYDEILEKVFTELFTE